MDYTLKQRHLPLAQRLLNDMIFAKQSNYARTDADYVVMDKHDMIGTHLLIFETSELYQPRLIYGIRLTYSSRAKTHKMKTPLQDLRYHLSSEAQSVLMEFITHYPELIEVNSLFVEEGFSAKNSGLNLSDIGFAMIYLHLSRLGFGHFAACPNEKYKAHRLVERVATVKNNRCYEFIHPVVRDPHSLMLVDSFKKDYLHGVIQNNSDLFENLLDVVPAELNLPGIQQVINYQLQTSELKKAG
jgi:hypothetical protein